MSINDPNGHYLPTTFKASNPTTDVTLTPSLYKDVKVQSGITVLTDVDIYVLDKLDNRIGPFRSGEFGTAHVASALVNGSADDFRLLVEDARYERYEGPYNDSVELTARVVCGLSVTVASTESAPVAADFTARLSWSTGTLLQEAPGGATTFSFDCAAGPADGE